MESSGRRKVLATFALIAVVASGCAGIYREPGVEALQPGEYAIIERGSNDSEIRVISIDGKALQNPNLQRLEVRPGTRMLKVQLVRAFESPKPTSPTSFMEVHLVAGKTYILTYAARSLGPGKGGIFRIWAMDKGTGLTVSNDLDEAGRRR